MVSEAAAAEEANNSASDADAADAANAAVQAVLQQAKFAAVIECAYLIASADGTTSADELSNIKSKVAALTEGAVGEDLAAAFVKQAEGNATEHGRDARIANLATSLEADGDREIAFLVGANAAWTGGGVGAKEGLAMQAIAKAFGWEISHMHKLLGKARG